MSDRIVEKGRSFTRRAYSGSVKDVQRVLGTREQNERLEQMGRPRIELDQGLTEFVQARDSLYLGTASLSGEPYIQHRGGDPGFIKVLDQQTLQIEDFPGNGQFITLGNLMENPRAFLFMIDYETATRVKFWTRGKVSDLNAEPRVLTFNLDAWDINCSKHLPELYSVATLKRMSEKQAERISQLEQQLAEYKT